MTIHAKKYGGLRLSMVVAAALVAATAVGMPSASAVPAQECTGTLGAVTVDRLVVPAGETCRLQGTTVNGNIVLGVGSALITNDATVNASVRAIEGPRTVRILDTTVTGNIRVVEATNRIVIGNAGCTVDPLAATNIQLVRNNGSIAICMMTIEENLQLFGNKGRIGVFDNNIGNNLQVQRNTDTIARFRSNVVGYDGGANIHVFDNATDVRLRNNDFRNNLACRRNAPQPSGSGNTGTLQGQCKDLG